MSKYIYDIKSGHYVLKSLSEAAANTQTVDGEEDNNDSKSSEKSSQSKDSTDNHLKNLETPEIEKDRQTMQNTLYTLFDMQLKKKNDNLIQLQSELSKLNLEDKVDKSAILKAQSNILQIQQDINTLEFKKAKMKYDMQSSIASKQKILISAASGSVKVTIPNKYAYLNESNIQNAKIHVNKLIKNDSMERIKGMADFKKAFKDSKLLYGKDSKGYFAVCVDQDDFNRLTDTLEEVGYLRNDILAVCLPLIFDRSGLATT